MTRARFTPGPWRRLNNWSGKLFICGPKSNDDRICNLPRRKDGQGEFNQALVAAAPDLYAVAAEIIYGDGTDASLQRAINLAIDALKKVDG